MIGILVALKSIFEIDAVVGALGALDAGLNVAGLFSIMKAKLPKDSIEIQMISALDESLRESCKKLGWYYDSMAAYMWLDVEKILSSTVMTKESLDNALELLTGKQINEMASNMFIDCFDKSVAGKPELFRYLNQKWQRYIVETPIPPEPISVPQGSVFRQYYKYVEKKFIKNKSEEYVNLVGTYSDEDAYIDAYINVNNEDIPVLSYLEKWFRKDTYGSLLIHGEPGHGKTTLCYKAMFEFSQEKFLNTVANNVIMISLNTGHNSSIIKDKQLHLENALAWGGDKQHTFCFEDCRGALLFMDGFDEFIDEARAAKIDDIITFMKKIDAIAEEYDMHIVVLSRTTAVKPFLYSFAINSFALAPISDVQQDLWLDDHKEYDDYKEKFKELRKNASMSDLLGIPFLFRMIVQSRFDEVSTNVVELYDKLINHLMEKRDIRGKELEHVITGLNNLAYNIYCANTDTTYIGENENDNRWIVAFYVKQYKEGRIGFYHRSFYQYFLARYIYSLILNLGDINPEGCIGLFAERELDATTLEYLSLMINEEKKNVIHNSLKLLVDALVKTEAFVNLEPKYLFGDAETTKLGRAQNVFRNTLHICSALSYVIQIPFKDSIDVFFRYFHGRDIKIYSNNNCRANLAEVNLIRADFRGADMRRANLRGADFGRADLRGVNLSGADLREAVFDRADLSGANLSGANLSKAQIQNANLTKANLARTDLSEAILNKADLSYANLTEAHGTGIVLRGADLREADLCKSNVNNSDFSGSEMFGSNLCEADLSSNDFSGTDLRRANINTGNLSGSNLSGTYLKDAELRGADLTAVNLRGADLRSALLIGSTLCGACLINANLEKANLKNTNLFETNFCGANINGVNLRGANLNCTDLRVNNVKGLIIDIVNKGRIDNSLKDYDTIHWS